MRKSHDQMVPVGQKIHVFFIDDLNLPASDAFQTQNTLQLLREVIDHKKWFRLEKFNLMRLDKLMFCSSYNYNVNAPSSTQPRINSRLIRHFFPMNHQYNQQDKLEISLIYAPYIVSFINELNKFDISNSLITKFCHITEGIYQMHLEMKNNASFKKTPIKFHYEFNYNAITKVC